MIKQIIFTVVLVLIGCGSFIFGLLSCRSVELPEASQIQPAQGINREFAVQDDQSVQEETDGAAGFTAITVRQRNPVTSFILPDLNEEKGVQKSFSDKSDQLLYVWETLNVTNGVINILQSAQIAGGDALSPIDSIMKKVSNQLSFAFSLILFWKVLLAVSGFMIFLAVIPVCALVTIIVIWTYRDRKSVHRVVIAFLLAGMIIPFAIPASFKISELMDNHLLSVDVNSITASIDEKRGTADTMERILLAGRQGSATASFITDARTLGDDLIADTINYFIMFVFVYVIIPVLFLLTVFFLARYFVKLILNRKV